MARTKQKFRKHDAAGKAPSKKRSHEDVKNDVPKSESYLQPETETAEKKKKTRQVNILTEYELREMGRMHGYRYAKDHNFEANLNHYMKSQLRAVLFPMACSLLQRPTDGQLNGPSKTETADYSHRAVEIGMGDMQTVKDGVFLLKNSNEKEGGTDGGKDYNYLYKQLAQHIQNYIDYMLQEVSCEIAAGEVRSAAASAATADSSGVPTSVGGPTLNISSTDVRLIFQQFLCSRVAEFCWSQSPLASLAPSLPMVATNYQTEISLGSGGNSAASSIQQQQERLLEGNNILFNSKNFLKLVNALDIKLVDPNYIHELHPRVEDYVKTQLIALLGMVLGNCVRLKTTGIEMENVRSAIEALTPADEMAHTPSGFDRSKIKKNQVISYHVLVELAEGAILEILLGIKQQQTGSTGAGSTANVCGSLGEVIERMMVECYPFKPFRFTRPIHDCIALFLESRLLWYCYHDMTREKGGFANLDVKHEQQQPCSGQHPAEGAPAEGVSNNSSVASHVEKKLASAEAASSENSDIDGDSGSEGEDNDVKQLDPNTFVLFPSKRK